MEQKYKHNKHHAGRGHETIWEMSVGSINSTLTLWPHET
jgi:hypothetical protein